MLGSGRENVENAAADRELAAFADHVHPGVGQLDEPHDEFVERDFGADIQRDRFDLRHVGGHRLQQ